MRTIETLARHATAAMAAMLISALPTGPADALEGGPPIKSGYAPANGLRIYYEIHGAAHETEPPLVLLHGGGSTIDTSFGKVLPSLAKTRQVIAFEQQGHGRPADVDHPEGI